MKFLDKVARILVLKFFTKKEKKEEQIIIKEEPKKDKKENKMEENKSLCFSGFVEITNVSPGNISAKPTKECNEYLASLSIPAHVTYLRAISQATVSDSEWKVSFAGKVLVNAVIISLDAKINPIPEKEPVNDPNIDPFSLGQKE